MGMRKVKLIQKLINLSREQAPDNWSRLRGHILAETAFGKTPQSSVVLEDKPANERSTRPMKRSTTWIVALSSSAAIIIAITLTVVLLLSRPADIRFEAGETVTLANGSLYINVITPNGGKIGVSPDAEYVDLTFADLPGIFGRSPFPVLPDGFKPDSDTITAMMFRSGTVFLMNGISFSSNPDDAQAARIVFDLNDRGELPISDCRFGTDKTSELDGVEIMLGVQMMEGDGAPYELYTAEFVAHDIGYRIRATNMTGAEFLAILQAVITG